MSPWPGTPKSQQSPPINPPSVRKFPTLTESSTMGEVAGAIKIAFDGLTNHEQAFANLPSQIASQAATAAQAAVENITNETTEGVTSFNSSTGAILYFPSLGMVNDQLGNPLYLTQQSDAGAKIVMGDSSPATVTLNSAMMPPWFAFIGNDSGATVSLTTDSSATISGIQSIYPGGMAIVFYDGETFYCEGVAIATDSSLGVVQPDNVTIGIDSGMIYTQISVDSGPPMYTPNTLGNPFYFDSTASPWNAYVWFNNQWNQFG